VKLYANYFMLDFVDYQFRSLPWEEILFVEPSVHSILRQARVQCADSVPVRMGMAEEDFEGAGRHNDECGMMKDEIRVVEL